MPHFDELPYPSRYNSLRLLGYDYTSIRKLCAITVVADERRPLFSDMLLAKSILASLLSPETLAGLHLQAFTLMPDHIHLIGGARHSKFDLSNLIAGFKSFTTQYVPKIKFHCRSEIKFHERTETKVDLRLENQESCTFDCVRSGWSRKRRALMPEPRKRP
jgi:REP element-mobilizing transposase RayT